MRQGPKVYVGNIMHNVFVYMMRSGTLVDARSSHRIGKFVQRRGWFSILLGLQLAPNSVYTTYMSNHVQTYRHPGPFRNMVLLQLVPQRNRYLLRVTLNLSGPWATERSARWYVNGQIFVLHKCVCV